MVLSVSCGLTVSEVAGLIAGGITLAQLTFPLFVAALTVWAIQGRKLKAATWTVASGAIQSSLWPVLLQGDASVSRHVEWRVQVLSQTLLVCSVVLTIASFLTPISLRADLKASGAIKNLPFTYAPDPSFLGQATVAKTLEPFHRICRVGYIPSVQFIACPFSYYLDEQGNDFYYEGTIVVNSTIPDETLAAFEPAVEPSTVVGALDIRYRRTHRSWNDYIDSGNWRSIGGVQAFKTFLLNDAYVLVEGLIVDARSGAIGFRNHTLPHGTRFGAKWTENILWLEPTTQCVDTNISFLFRKASPGYDISILDEGGIADLTDSPPGPSWEVEGSQANWNISGPVPDLLGRASQAAWWNNHLTKQYLNITRSKRGATYSKGISNIYAEVDTAWQSEMDGNFITEISDSINSTNSFLVYNERCSGYNDNHLVSSTKPYISCGYLYGVPRPYFTNQTWSDDYSSLWKQPLYTCASSIRASVKTIGFATDGGTKLSDLRVTDVQSQNSTSHFNSPPTWAVETAKAYYVQNLNRLWGVVNATEYQPPSVNIQRTHDLYLPAAPSWNSLSSNNIHDNFPAGIFSAVMNDIYSGFTSPVGSLLTNIPSYSGALNYGQALKYRELSATPSGAANLINLIWTDLVAFTTTTSITGFEAQEQRLQDGVTILGNRGAYVYKSYVTYSDYRWAIPAMVAGAAWLSLCLVMLISLAFRWLRWTSLNEYVNRTTLGRALTATVHPEPCSPYAKTKIWVARAGGIPFGIPQWPSAQSALPGISLMATPAVSSSTPAANHSAPHRPRPPPPSQPAAADSVRQSSTRIQLSATSTPNTSSSPTQQPSSTLLRTAVSQVAAPGPTSPPPPLPASQPPASRPPLSNSMIP